MRSSAPAACRNDCCAATTRLVILAAIRADAAGTMPAIRSAPSARPSRASTAASATLSTWRARRLARRLLMCRRTPPKGWRRRLVSSSKTCR